MKLGFNLFGVDITLIDTSVPTVEQAVEEQDCDRWNELLDQDEDLTDEEWQEYEGLSNGLAERARKKRG